MEKTHNWTTEQWVEADKDHHLHPFTGFSEQKKSGSRIIEKAKGVFIYDSEGNEFLDGMAGLW